MYLPRKLMIVGALLCSLGLSSTGTAFAKSKQAKPLLQRKSQIAVKAKAPPQLPKIGNKLPFRPRLGGIHSLAKTAPEQSAAGSSASAAPRAAVRPGARLDSTKSRIALDGSKIRSQIENSLLAELAKVTEVVQVGPGTTGAQVRGNALDRLAAKAGTIKTSDVAQQLGSNSSTLRALEEVMPGFQNRGHGASSLKDLGGTGGNHRNPVTGATSMSNFTGGGAGRYSDDYGGASIKQFKDGSSVSKVGGGNGEKPVITTKIPGTGTLVINSDDSRTYTLDSGKIIYYDSNGKKIGEVTMGEPTVTSGKGGKTDPKKETTPDSETGSSGPVFVTGAQLRGLAARLGAAGTPTGEEASTGGPVDKSRTREGRIAQVDQPTPEGAAAQVVPDAMQIRQVMRIKMRNVTPILD